MSFQHYFNMERLALNVAEKAIGDLPDKREYDDGIPIVDDTAMQALEKGSIAIIMLNIFIESYINDILNNCIEEKTDGFLKCNLTEKLELIYLYYRKDISELRKTYGWQVFKESQKIRNGIVHFKKSEMGYSGYTPDLFIEKSSLNELFLKEPMKKYMDEIIGFAKRIAED